MRHAQVPIAIVLFVTAAAIAGDAPDGGEAARILREAGVRGGLAVHVGCGDPSTGSGQAGMLTAALRAGDRFLVHGLDGDAADVEKARACIRSQGLYGPVSVEQWQGGSLPYADNLVNLLVVEDGERVPAEEMMRVLVPNGTAYVKKAGTWTKTVKPRPDTIDDWTHFLYGSDNNAVARDTVVGPPARVQWVDAPKWSRNHTVPSVSAVVSAAGRLFSLVDEGPPVDAPRGKAPKGMKVPQAWNLIARDAFNGIVLWKKPFEEWIPPGMGFKNCLLSYQRRFIASGETVYFTPGLAAPVTAFDAATGEVVHTYEGTARTDEFVLADGRFIALVQKNRAAGNRPALKTAPDTVMAVDAATGKILWERSVKDTALGVLAARDGRVFYPDDAGIVCADASSGEETWRAAKLFSFKDTRAVAAGVTVVALEKVVLCANGAALTARANADGTIVWNTKCPPGYNNPADVFMIGGLVWAAENGPGPKCESFSTGRDPATGDIKKRMDVKEVWEPGDMGHHRCYRNRATDRFILVGQSGTGFIDLDTGESLRNDWVRGCCGFGVLPCNGLLYAPSHACACYVEAKLNGFWALAPAGTHPPAGTRASDDGRFVKGPAFDTAGAAAGAADAGDWPTFRHNASRSGAASCDVPSGLKPLWQVAVGGTPSAPVSVEGNVFVADADAGIVHAVDAAKGAVRWSFTAGGRVDSPPTVAKGRAVFGSRDGRVYCLRVSDGALVWRFRAAPEERRVVAFGRLESTHPVHGSTLVLGDTVYFAAGRSSFLDGGIYLYRLDLATGRKVSETRVYAPDPETGMQPKPFRFNVLRNQPSTLALPDILSSDGRAVYMRHTVFDPDGALQDERKPHIYSTAGFLNDEWYHRTYTAYAEDFGSAVDGWSIPGHMAPAGRLLVAGESAIYGFGRTTYMEKAEWPAYHLFASEKKPSILKEGVEFSHGKIVAKDKSAKEGFTRRFIWSQKLPFSVRAMALAGDTLCAAGPVGNIVLSQEAREGAKGSVLWTLAAGDGTKRAEYALEAPPVFDGMIVARGRIYAALVNGTVVCMGAE